MRLTLRTLLAYRDGVLSQADHDDLHRRIQQSPDASNLLRRIQEITSATEPLSPKLDSPGLGSPNVIAEYLDDVLNSSNVAELERLFLEYNEHLCELAHCHQMIAQAMHTHVEVPARLRELAAELVDPNKRQSIKSQLLTQSRKLAKQPILAEIAGDSPNVVEQSPVATSSAPVVEVASGVAATSQSSPIASGQNAGLNLEGSSLTTEVPEYLLGARQRRWQIPVAILALTALLLLVLWQSIGSWDDVRALMAAKEPVPPAADQPSVPVEALPTDANAGNNQTTASESAEAPVNDVESVADSSAKVNEPQVEAESTSNADPSMTAVEGPAATAAVPETADVNENSAQPADVAAPALLPTLFTWQPADDAEAESVVLLSTDAAPVLLQPNQQPLSTGSLLLPPVARTTLQFEAWKCLSVGPSQIRFEVNDANCVLESSQCRLLISKTGTSDEVLLLKTPAGDFELQILDPAAWLGVECGYRAVMRGSLVEPGVFEPVLIVVVGADSATTQPVLATIRSSGSAEMPLQIETVGKGVAAFAADKIEPFNLQTPPAWYRKRSLRAIDQLGMRDFRAALSSSSTSIRDRLRELSADQRPEVAALAIQTALLQGDWQPFATELLTSDRMRSHWTNTLDLARQLIAINPEILKQVQLEFESKFGADARQLLELLVGLEKSHQNSDGLSSLVKVLDANQLLPVRVLAAYELKQLTGVDFSYQPHAPVRASIQQWRSKIASGKVGLLPITDPISERIGQ